MKLSIKILAALTTSLAIALGIIYSGIIDPGATSPHTMPVRWLLSTTMHASVERRASKIEIPEFTEQMQLAGANDFNNMCAACHGAPGQDPEAIGQGLNPAPPDLAESAQRASAAELFWVTKNGLRMTGMPAWGNSHDDASLWPLVAFMMTLPDLDARAYQDILIRAEGIGHHAADEKAPHDHDADVEIHEEDSHKNDGHAHAG